MTREEIMNSFALKKRFCKDCGLHIAVFDNPYFYERLQTLDPLEDCVSKFDAFCNELQLFKNEQEYFEYYNSVKTSIIDFIKSVPEYESFINAECKCVPLVPKKSLYTKQNDGRSFISIDMNEANFSAMRHYSSEIFDNCVAWGQFVSKFTYDYHIINSKHIRQVVLGHCNPGKQVAYEQYLMNILCSHILNSLPNVSIYSLSKDEIIIEVPDNGTGFSMKELKCVIGNCQDGIGLLVRVDSFELSKINGGWIKIYNDDSDRVEFKCVDLDIYHQIVKRYFGEPITDNDLIFKYKGRLAQFLDSIYFDRTAKRQQSSEVNNS